MRLSQFFYLCNRVNFLTSLLLGGYLAVFAQVTPSQAETHTVSAPMVQQPSLSKLPPPLISSKKHSFLLSNRIAQIQDFESPYYQNNYQYNEQYNGNTRSYNQNFGGYRVYVFGGSRSLLSRVRGIAPNAFIKQISRGSVIQAGAFDRESNAQRLASRLQFSGYNAGVFSSNSGQEIPDYPVNYPDSYSYRNFPGRNRSNYYYVVVPALSQNLSSLEQSIRQRLGYTFSGNVLAQKQPRGPHVRVGPFTQQWQAERFNKRLQELGFDNARVYYGK